MMNRDYTPSPNSDNLKTGMDEKLKAMQAEIDEDELLKKRASNVNQEDYDLSKSEQEELINRKKTNPLFQGCNSIENYIYLNKIHEGSFGIVFRAKEKLSNLLYAIKNIKIERDGSGYSSI